VRLFFALSMSFFATSALAQLSVENPWARPTPPNAKLAAGYLTVVNAAGAPDRLVGASSPAAGRVEMHVNIKDGNILRMREVKDLKVSAGGRLELKPAGAHLMFVGIKAPFRQGDTVPVTLRFEKAGDVEVALHVGQPSPHPHNHKH
jgi:copper(I)-binding protein